MNESSDDKLKEEALYEALNFIKSDLGFSSLDIAILLRASGHAVNHWFCIKAVSLDEEALSAVIDFIAIHRSLCSMFSNKKNRMAWLKSPHPDFQNKRPLDVMKEVDGLFAVRTYLAAAVKRGA